MRHKQRPRAGIFIGEGDSAKAGTVNQVKGRTECRTGIISIKTETILPKPDRLGRLASKLKEPTAAQHIVKIEQMESSDSIEGARARAQDECGAGGKCEIQADCIAVQELDEDPKFLIVHTVAHQKSNKYHYILWHKITPISHCSPTTPNRHRRPSSTLPIR